MEFAEAIQRLKEHEADLKKMGVKRLYMFGSMVRGDQRPDSDVDLFFDYDEGTIGLEFFHIQDAVTELLGCKTDVMTRGGIHPLIKAEVEQSALQVF